MPIIGTATFAVDSFFFLSGMLTFYILTPKLKDTSKPTSYIMLYIHRYLRLAIHLLFCTLFIIGIVPFIGTGPNWKTMEEIYYEKPCGKYWWSNFLFLNNLVPWAMS